MINRTLDISFQLTAHDNACFGLESSQGKIQHLAADIVEVDIKITDRILELVVERGALIVQGRVDLEFLSQPSALFVCTGDPYDLRAGYFTNLAHQRADVASRSRNHECLTGLDFRDI